METSKSLKIRRNWIIVGLILTLQILGLAQLPLGYKLAPIVQFVCFLGMLICIGVILTTFWLAIVKKAAWKEVVLYLIAFFIALSALGYAIAVSLRPTPVELQPPSNVHYNHRPKK
jgi:hypothetical protein